MIKDVTDLQIYNHSLNLLEHLYKLANRIPQNHGRLKSQVINASEAIAPQIAEGFAKKKAPKEFCRFLSMALVSSDEVITHLREIKILSKSYLGIKPEEVDLLIEQYKILSKRLNRLLASWQKFA